MILFLLYYGYRIGFSIPSFLRAITDTVLTWNEFWGKLFASLRAFTTTSVTEQMNTISSTFNNIPMLDKIVAISQFLGILFIFLKYGWGIFKYYSVQLDEGVSPLTIEYIKKTVFSLIFVLIAPYIVINGFYLTNVVTSVAVTALNFEIDGGVNLDDDFKNNHLSYKSYCGDNVYEASQKESHKDNQTSPPPNNYVVSKAEYDLIHSDFKQDEDTKKPDSNKSSDIAKNIEAAFSSQDGQLKGLGKYFTDYAIKKGVDPYLAAAITIQESGWGGTSPLAKNHNNFGGVICHNGADSCTDDNWSHWNTPERGIEGYINNVYNTFVSKGMTTPTDISKGGYCVSSTGGECPDWVKNVTIFYNQMSGGMTITDEELEEATRFDVAKLFKDGDNYVMTPYKTLWSSQEAATKAGYDAKQFTGPNMATLYEKYCHSYTIKNDDGSSYTEKPFRTYQTIENEDYMAKQVSFSVTGIIASVLVVFFGLVTFINMGIRLAELLVLLMMTPFFAMEFISVKQSYALRIWCQEFTSICMTQAVTTVLFQVFIYLFMSNNFWSNFLILIGLAVIQLRGPSALRAWSHNTGTVGMLSNIANKFK